MMKKIVMTVAVAAMMMTAGVVNAQVKDDQNTENTEVSSMQQDYEEIQANKLPKAVSEAVKKDYQGATISKAYVDKKKKEYKLMLQTEGTAETQTVYANKKGEWIQKDDASQDDSMKDDSMDSDY